MLHGREWSGSSWMSGNGVGFGQFCRRSEDEGVRRWMIGGSSRRCFGGGGRGCHGGICPRSSDHGRRSSTGSIAGRKTASGAGCSKRYKPRWTRSGTAWTPRSTGPTSTRLAEKGAASQRDRAVTRGPFDQGTSDSRCTRPPCCFRGNGRTARRRCDRAAAARARSSEVPLG